MAWSFTNDLFAAPVNANSASTTISGTVSSARAVGTVNVIFVGIDNGGTAAGDSTEITVSDSKGNVYTRAKEQTQGGSANASATVGIFYSVLTVALTNTDTVTATFSSRAARAMYGMNGTIDSGNTITVVDPIGQGGTGAPTAPQHTAGTVGLQYLACVATAIESNVTTGQYTAFDGAVCFSIQTTTSGGGSTANIALRMGYLARVLAVTNPVWTIGTAHPSGDHRSVAVLLRETVPAPTGAKPLLRVTRQAVSRASFR